MSADFPNPILATYWLREEAAIDADLAALRESGPIKFSEPYGSPFGSAAGVDPPTGSGAWALTSHAQVLAASKAPGVFSSAAGITVADVPKEFNEFFSSMIAMDDPRHARLRRIVARGFTPRTLARLDDSVASVAAAILDSIENNDTVDFVTEVAAALPLKIVCDLMGIPDSQYQFVFDRTNVILGVGDPEFRPESGDIVNALLTAGAELASLMNSVAEHKRGGDGEDLTSQLVNADLGDDMLSAADLASFFILLVVAGNETTRNATSWGMKYLTDNPEQRHRWLADIDGLAPTAVEEIVRLASPVTYMRRTLLEDFVLDGVPILAGEKVMLFYLAANRDPAVFGDPLHFDVTRHPNPHVGFGGPGPHYCLGAHLARRELTEIFRQLLRRFPRMQVSGPPDLLGSSFIHGIKHMPVTLR